MPAKNAREIAKSILTNLKILDPAISGDPITPERKIIDTVSEEIASAYVDQYVLQYQYDIDTKIGDDLDSFVALFGFARQSGKRATGQVTFSRSAPAIKEIVVSAGSTIIKSGTLITPTVIFFTTGTGIIPVGETSIEVPIEASVEGAIGNVEANTITQIGSTGISDVSDVYNENATTGGTGLESDAQLRVRFKNTIFRNIAGTKDQFLALAIASRFANKATVIPPISIFAEYLQFPSGSTSVTSQIPFSKYTYNWDYFITNGNLDNEIFYEPALDYTFNPTVPPSITSNNIATTLSQDTNFPVSTVNVVSTTGFKDAGSLTITKESVPTATVVVSYTGKTSNTFTGVTGGSTIGEIIDPGTFPTGSPVRQGQLLPGDTILMEHRYCSAHSRNNPTTNILNYIDVYVAGLQPQIVNESTAFPSNTFNATTTSPYYNLNYLRESGQHPLIGNYYQSLLWQPIISLPESIDIGSYTFFLNKDYWLVKDTTTYQGSKRGRDGIEWRSTIINVLASGSIFLLEYTFNKLPLSLNELMDEHKAITNDVLTHSSWSSYLVINLVMMYSIGYDKTSVNEAVSIALSDFLERQNFGTTIQISDILEVAHEVSGVDNVRLTRSNDGVAHGIQEVAADGITNLGPPRNIDFILQDNTLPVLQKVVITSKSQNTYDGTSSSDA